MSLIQFPLRFSAVSVFTASFGVALLIKYLPYRRTLFATFLILVIYANRNHWRINEVFDPGESYYLSLQTTTASFNEHLPKWARKMELGPAAKLEFVNGAGVINQLEDKSVLFRALVEATSGAKLRFNQFYFPGWEVNVDNKPVHFNYLVDGESYGLPVFDIDKGKHLIKAEFKNTPVRDIGDGISIITVIIIIIIICRLLIQR